MNPHYEFVATRAKHRCEYCGAPEVVFNFPFEIEHIIPVCLGGRTIYINLALACRACNLYKSSRILIFDAITQAEVRLFNPREDDWGDHFEIDLEAGEIKGVTSIGRVTVEQLQMNNPTQLTARVQWIQWGVYP